MNTLPIVLLLLSAVCLSAMITPVAAQQRDPTIVAIDAAIQSLKEQPNQFSLTVMAVGAVGISSGGGTGIRVEAHGGGPGSQTTGLVATASDAQINIVQTKADEKLKQEADKAVKLLSEIKTLIQTPKPDQSTISSKLSDLAKTYVAPVLTSVITALIKVRLRLP